MDSIVSEVVQQLTDNLGYLTGAVLILLLMYEGLLGRYNNGKKTKEDWMMGLLALSTLAYVQRPLLTVVIFFTLGEVFPESAGAFRWVDTEYFGPALLVYLLVDEYLHGRAHLLSHSKWVENPALRKYQAFLKIAHRPHHQLGANDGRGELSVTQTYVEHWGWWLALPNYWFGLVCLYFGLYEVFFWGTAGKAIWGMHVHTNWGWSYDLALLNHKNRWVRKVMFALCHVVTFPNMHHQHHSRSANSAKNMCNLISVWDWLLWDSLVIEKERPEIYGWRQTPKEEHNPFYRFLNTNFNRV